MLPMFGRSGELAVLVATLDAAARGERGVVLVSGEPGIGKTRLVEEVVGEAARRGMQVAWGRCWELGGAPAYWPWIQVFRSVLDADPDTAIPGVRKLVARDAQLPERFELFDDCVRCVASAGTANPLVIVIDDLHVADTASVLLLAFLARHLRGRVMLVATYREAELERRVDLRESLATVVRDARRIPLAPLATDDVRAWLGDARADVELSQRLHDLSGGNPLFVGELLHLVQAGRAHAPRNLPESVLAAIREHARNLPDETRVLLGHAAIFGRELSVALVAELAAVPEATAHAALREAERGRVLIETGTGRYRFSHVLVCEALVEELEPAERAALHRRAAEALERADQLAPGDRSSYSAIAYHYLHAGAEAAAPAIEAGLRAADAAMRALAFEDAARELERVLELGTTTNFDQRRPEILSRLGEAWLRSGRGDDGRRTCTQAAELARARGDHAGLVRAALAYGAQVRPGVVDARMIALLEEARGGLPDGDSATRAQISARLGAAMQPSTAPARSIELALDAVAIARRIDDAEVLLDVLVFSGSALMDYHDAAVRLPMNDELVRLAAARDRDALVFRGCARLVFDHLALGDLAGVERELRRLASAAAAFHQPSYHWQVPIYRAMLALQHGRSDEADHHAREAAARVDAADDPIGRRCLAMHRFGAAWIGMRLDELDAYAGALDETFAPVPTTAHIARAVIDARQGRVEAARRELGTVSHDVAAAVACNHMLASWLAEAAWTLDDRELAERLRPGVQPHVRQLCSWGMIAAICDGSMARPAMLLAATTGRPTEAAAYFVTGRELAERLELVPHGAQLRVDYATVLLRDGGPSANAEAAALLAEAKPVIEALGLAGLRARLDLVHVPELPRKPAPTTEPITMLLEGEYWVVGWRGRTFRFRDSRGFQILAKLVEEPGKEHHVLALGADKLDVIDGGDAGEALDGKAIAAYRRRLEELASGIDDAEARNDLGRLETLRAEEDAITSEISRAIGLGGRTRRVGGNAERARINVQRRITHAISRIREVDAHLADYVARSIRTGIQCVYIPIPLS